MQFSRKYFCSLFPTGIFEQQAERLDTPVAFHGFLEKTQVNKHLAESHALILPSKSEGFPKVIGEAMNYGCVPLVTDISCMKDYITHNQNGILIKNQTKSEVVKAFENLLNFNSTDFKNAIEYNSEVAKKFTYSYYNKMLKEKIVNV